MPNETPPPGLSIAGWDEFVDVLRLLPQRLLAKLPPELSADPQIRQEVARLALASLCVSAIETIGADGDHPAFLPNQNLVLNLPMPNADTIYRVAHLTPGGTYRLRGKAGSLRMAHLSQIGGGPGAARSYIDLSDLKHSADGDFDLILGPDRPSGHDGDFWPLLATTNRLLFRMVSANWRREQDPTLSIERLDHPPQRPRPSAAALEQRLRALPAAMSLLPMMFVDRVAKLRAEGYVNTFKTLDLAQMGGVSGQAYFDAAYELEDHEALLLEAGVPVDCDYFSLILGNDLHETTDWHNNHSSLNDAQAHIDSDAVLRVVISAKDCGALNWLDTAGYKRGLLQARWMCSKAIPTPTLRKLPLQEVLAAMPKDTPVVTAHEREETIRARRFRLQQRPHW